MTTAGTVEFDDSDGDVIYGPIPLGDGGVLLLDFEPRVNGYHAIAPTNKGLAVKTVTGHVDGYVKYAK